ncbi:MAG: hypothetical protein EOO66_30545, partial [Methylobacterium sp.]
MSLVPNSSLQAIALTILFGVAGCAQGPALPPPTPAVSNVSVGKEVVAAVRNNIEVKFANGSDRLAPEAGNQLDLAARLFRDVRPVSMFSTGYSDATGSEYDNLILSAKRAIRAILTVRARLAERIRLSYSLPVA